MTQEQKFLDALKDIFVGAPVEGDSGFINLMKIKACYFEQAVFPQLLKDVDKATKPFEKSFREELFDKLFAFFNRYFSESGSIYFRHTPLHQNIYERIYTDDRDVMLFWKTHMLYYVKTDRLFQSMGADVDGEKFWFDVSAIEHKRANEKRELTYALQSRKADGTLVFTVAYSEKGRRTKTIEILRAIKETGVTLVEDTLLHAFRIFEKQSEVDYFINKNAKAFLKEQFDLWLYQYVFSGENAFTETRLKQLQVLKDVAFHIIDFIAQFEDELVRVWNKPKFVLNSNYIISLDKIASSTDLFARLLKHKGMAAQVDEWRALGMVDEKFKPEEILQKDKLFDPIHSKYQFLPLDTRYFKDLELDILALFDDLDAALDGWLVHSENYQALNTILPKFHERIKVIYIDPPYNTGNDEFIYKDQFLHASWITMIENRLLIAKQLLNSLGMIFVNIDENEQPRLRLILENVFEPDNYVVPLIWTSRAGKSLTASTFQIAHEHIESAAKNKTQLSIKPMRKVVEGGRYKDEKGEYNRELLRQWGGQHDRREERPNLYYPIPTPWGNEAYPKRPDGSDGNWRCSRDNAKKMLDSGDLDFVRDETTGEITVYRKIRVGQVTYSVPSNMLNDVGTSTDGTKTILDLFGGKIFNTAKPPKLVQRLVDFVSWKNTENDIVLDFFSGSGTTAQAVMNLNRSDGGKRKYILVEMGEYFHTIILPRVKKVAFSDKWKKGKANGGQGMSQFVKYYELEQYEDTLRRARYESTDAPLFQMTDVYSSYVFLRDLKLLDAVSLDKKADRIEVHPETLYDDIDLAESLSCGTGKWIKRITKDNVEFEDGTTASLSDLDWNLIKPLIWW